MTTQDHSGGHRAPLMFPDIVREHFYFLKDYGFNEVESNPTLIEYRYGDLQVVVYHGRSSFEIGVKIGFRDEAFPLSALVRLVDAGAEDECRRKTARSREAVEREVSRLAGLLRRLGGEALRGSPQLFAELRKRRRAAARALELDVIANQERPKAELAFREGRYGDAVRHFERYYEKLSDVERAKLALARKRG